MSQGTAVTVTFAGTTLPQAVATQTGSGPFTAASLEFGNLLHLVVPTGMTKYSIAYVCADLNDEFVIEATVMDSTALTVSCPGFLGPSDVGLATGRVDAAAISGTTNLLVSGSGRGGTLSGTSGPFSVNMPVGSDDIAFVAFGAPSHALGVKILPSQSIPGLVNEGNTVVLGAGDAIVMQPATILNVPPGFLFPGVNAQYHTTHGTVISLVTGIQFNDPNPTTYPAVPAASVQNGDFYLYSVNTFDNAFPPSKQIGTSVTTTSGGGPVTIALPAPWSFAGPTPAAFPTFTFNYSGFSGLPAASQQTTLIWPVGPKNRIVLTVTATANFQNGATTLTIPDLTSLTGFFGPAPSGAKVSWIADIMGGTTQEFIFQVNPPPNGSLSFVENRGDYIEP
ncbi:MAG TPA: hypothetical protein VG488_03340 [Candidatus Angelobacter sp.]|nr:hypothetical protein [Candidatus Angelobacter sp.]